MIIAKLTVLPLPCINFLKKSGAVALFKNVTVHYGYICIPIIYAAAPLSN